MGKPKKYVKINGIMKLNPEWKKWKEQQGGGAPATTVQRPSLALPIVSSMEDHEKLNEAAMASGGKEIALAESTSATIEMMQEPEICVDAGMVCSFDRCGNQNYCSHLFLTKKYLNYFIV